MTAQEAKRLLRSTATMSNIGGSNFPGVKGGDVDLRLERVERAIAAIGRALDHLADVVDGLDADIVAIERELRNRS